MAISQNGQTHSNNLLPICQWIVWVCLAILWDWWLKGSKLNIVSSRVSAPPWKIDLTPFYIGSPKSQNILNLSDLSPLKILENLTPLPWSVPSSEKEKTHFLKKRNILFPTLNENIFECRTMNLQSQNLKIKEELGFF